MGTRTEQPSVFTGGSVTHRGCGGKVGGHIDKQPWGLMRGSAMNRKTSDVEKR